MNIALISYEYPPAVTVGGIGAYAAAASRMLSDSGHTVVVFAAGPHAETRDVTDRLRVHRIPTPDRRAFAAALVPSLLADHALRAFDVIEAPEIGPEGGAAFVALPTVARVVKLHTPTYLITRVGWDTPPWSARLRFWAASLFRGRWRTLGLPSYDRTKDPEHNGAILADEISAPCRAIADVVGRDWALPAEKLHVCHLPFRASDALLALPPPTMVKTVGFLGRLEPRKGVLEIVRALPAIIREAPHLRFRFIGPSWPYRGTDMQAWITRHHPRLLDHLEFIGRVDHQNIPAALAGLDAVLLPSRWENFPFACWEALASGRVVIGSCSGGMAEVIEDGVSGLLIDPRDPGSISSAVLRIANDAAAANRMAVAGRERVSSLLAYERVLPAQLACYERAIARASVRLTTSA